MTGYYIKQSLFMLLGFGIGAWFTAQAKPDFNFNKDFGTAMVLCMIGAGAGWFVAFATGKPKGDEE